MVLKTALGELWARVHSALRWGRSKSTAKEFFKEGKVVKSSYSLSLSIIAYSIFQMIPSTLVFCYTWHLAVFIKSVCVDASNALARSETGIAADIFSTQTVVGHSGFWKNNFVFTHPPICYWKQAGKIVRLVFHDPNIALAFEPYFRCI